MSDLNGRLGDPMDLPPREASTQAGSVRRAGDTGLGVPEFAPSESRTLSDEESAAHQEQMEAQLRESAEAMLSELGQDSGWKLPAPIRRFCSMVLVTISAVLGLFLVTETIQFAAVIETLPQWGQWLATGCLSVFGGVLIIVLLQLVWRAIRLQRSPRIHLEAMKALAERRHMQCVVAEKQAEARELLVDYLENYPLAGRSRRRMLAMGMSEEEWCSLQEGRTRLLDTSRPLTPTDWLDEFSTNFQGVLDKVARRRINQYAKRVGLGTAASPVAMVDRMIVLYGCVALAKELLTIYHLRPALGQTLVLLSRGIVQTYLSGLVEEAAEAAVDGAADSLAGVFGEGAGILTGTAGRVVGAKTAEAALNGYLLLRLGKRVMTQLQPVR